MAAGTYRKQGTRWVIANGGVRPRWGRDLKGRCLSFVEREQTAISRAAGESVRAIAKRLGRSPSTISRELRRNQEPGGGYRASSAHAMAYHRASRPKPACRWSARRLQRYLDADPAAPLQPADVQRLESHLATCRKCAAMAEEYRGVRRSLLRWSQRQAPDPAMVMRVRLAAERMLVENLG